jgi:hypothetical protein
MPIWMTTPAVHPQIKRKIAAGGASPAVYEAGHHAARLRKTDFHASVRNTTKLDRQTPHA